MMVPEIKQDPVTCVEELTFNAEGENHIGSHQELPTNNPETPEVNNEPDALKAFARALMVSLTWSLAGLTHQKRSS